MSELPSNAAMVTGALQYKSKTNSAKAVSITKEASMSNEDINHVKDEGNNMDSQDAATQNTAIPAAPITMPKISVPSDLVNMPTFSLPAETISALQGIQELQSSMASSVSAVIENYNMFQSSLSSVYENAKAISSAFSKLPDYASMVQGMYPAIQQITERIREATKGIDIKALAESMRPLALKARRIEILDKTNWPMYLANGEALSAALDSLPDNMTDEDLREQVTGIACEHLDSNWLAEVKERWLDHSEISAGEMRLLSSAIERHAKGDYEGCVSLLMGLFEGLLCKYAPIMKELDDEQAELFDMSAKAHGLSPSHRKDGKLRKLEKSKDQVLILVILSENGWYTFRHASNYIVGVTLTNATNEDLAAHNPLRNKICHGVQTKFDTQEHSLKAILVTDLIIRYGAAVLVGQNAISQQAEDPEE